MDILLDLLNLDNYSQLIAFIIGLVTLYLLYYIYKNFTEDARKKEKAVIGFLGLSFANIIAYILIKMVEPETFLFYIAVFPFAVFIVKALIVIYENIKEDLTDPNRDLDF